MDRMDAPIAYCGPAPEPGGLWSAWNPDPVAFLLCVALAATFLMARERGPAPAMGGALGLLLVLFISPLCALTVALFSARVVHHVLLIAVVAPLLALALPDLRRRVAGLPLGPMVLLQTAVLWFWHVPQVYAVAVIHPAAYWAMQATLLGSAMLYWGRLLSPRAGTGETLLAHLAMIVQMGMLGALLTFAARPLYEIHLTTTLPFGLTPLDDQQLGGLVMWVPAALPYLLAALLVIARRIEERSGIGDAGTGR